MTPEYTVPQSEVPAPPAGPGVVPPFSAPPRDRNNKGIWLGLGIGGLALVLCCVGGVFGLRFVLAGGTNLVRAQANTVVRDYLEALRQERYHDAYDMVCSAVSDELSLGQFQSRLGSPKVEAYVIDNVEVDPIIEVVATVTRRGRAPQQERYPVKQENTVLTVCPGV